MSRRGLGEYEPGRTGVSVSQLQDGESLTVLCTGDTFVQETSESDDAIHQPCVILDAPDGFEDMSGEPVETGGPDGDDPVEYNIINSSTAFYEALVRAGFQEGETDGQKLVIEAEQSGDVFSRKYAISAE